MIVCGCLLRLFQPLPSIHSSCVLYGGDPRSQFPRLGVPQMTEVIVTWAIVRKHQICTHRSVLSEPCQLQANACHGDLVLVCHPVESHLVCKSQALACRFAALR